MQSRNPFPRSGIAVALAAFLLTSAAAVAAPLNTVFVIRNETGLADELVHVKFLSSDGIVLTATPQTYGNGSLLATGPTTNGTSYTLKDMHATVPNTPYASTPVPTFSLNDYNGRIYFSLQDALDSTSSGGPAFLPNTGTDAGKTFGFVETSVFGTGTQNNLDISYVDFIGFPISAAARTSTGSLLALTNGTNPQITSADAITALASSVPAGAAVPNTLHGGTARVLSSVHSSDYHDWTNLMTHLQAVTATNPLKVASYDVPAGAPLEGTAKFTYVGGGFSTITPVLPAGFLTGQSYDFDAKFLTDLNPNGQDVLIPQLAGKAGAHLSGSAGSVGAFDIYITEDQLNAPTGIYGSNPNYVVVFGGQVYDASTGISNDLTGRIVGDLLAGIVFGWASNGANISSHASGTGTTLPSGVFTESTIGELGTGKYFYLLSLMDTPEKLAQWLGAGISSNPDYYDVYASTLASRTTAYGTGFGDRLQGDVEPFVFWPVTGAPAGFDDIGNGYIEITLVPEPTTSTLLLFGCLALAVRRRQHPAR